MFHCRKLLSKVPIVDLGEGFREKLQLLHGLHSYEGQRSEAFTTKHRSNLQKRGGAFGWWESYWNVLYIETCRDRRVAGMGASCSVFRLGGGGLILIPGGGLVEVELAGCSRVESAQTHTKGWEMAYRDD